MRKMEKSKAGAIAKKDTERKPMTLRDRDLFVPRVSRTFSLEYRLRVGNERLKPLYPAERPVFFRFGKETTKVVISCVNDLNDFYVIREEDQMAIDEMTESLNTLATFGLPAYHPMREEVNVACAVNEYKQWCRIKILKIEPPAEASSSHKVHVLYIDSGNQEILDPTSIHTAPDWVLDKPQYAYRSSLLILPVDYTHKGERQAEEDSWAPQIIDALRNLGKYHSAAEQNAYLGLELTMYRKDNDRSFVNLKLIGKQCTWAGTLVEYGVAKWMDGVPGTK